MKHCGRSESPDLPPFTRRQYAKDHCLSEKRADAHRFRGGGGRRPVYHAAFTKLSLAFFAVVVIPGWLLSRWRF